MTTRTDADPRPPRSPVYTTLRWLALLVIASTLVTQAIRGMWPFVIVGTAVCLIALAMWSVGYAADKRRERQFEADFGGSLDAVRASLDQPRLRTLRDTEGEVEAVRELRRETPQVSLLQAVELIRSL
ncbi:hypothetical protein QUV83_12655 [Cellulomonas cellasea]|uniref:hypothetical protein n=1 Tax=Cellulomonas cellasea TaxID=43670 RepID=UPI0025A42B32|nr:hypothetical protein [Cellulomonas cellasea]MDM8085618.1 hypothetical protein [Cellulomonas cellasea]